jgi:hypothetical protein
LLSETITVTREHYEQLKNQRLVLFAANNGEWSDEELEEHAVEAAMEAAGAMIETQQLSDTPLSQLTPEQFKQLLQQAAWAYMQVYVDYVPF